MNERTPKQVHGRPVCPECLSSFDTAVLGVVEALREHERRNSLYFDVYVNIAAKEI